MNKNLDKYNAKLLTPLADEEIKEFLILAEPAEADEQQSGEIEYYAGLMEAGIPVKVHFSYLKGHLLGGVFGTLELQYPIPHPVDKMDAEGVRSILEKEYTVMVHNIDRNRGIVSLYDPNTEGKRKKALDLIRKAREENRPCFVRGIIIGLQYNSGKERTATAAYVDIGGLGILGIIPLSHWSNGYTTQNYFISTINNNIGNYCNFQISSSTVLPDKRRAFICSRQMYKRAIGEDPWQIANKVLAKKANVIIKIVDKGKDYASFFGKIKGIDDLCVLCYADNRYMEREDIKLGKSYHGYVQRMDVKTKFLRVRLTGEAKEEGGSLEVVEKEK